MPPTSDARGAAASASPRGWTARARARLQRLVEDLRRNEGGPLMDRRTLVVLLITPVLLTVFYYYGRPEFYLHAFSDWGARTFGADWPYLGLLPYAYWALASVVLRVLVPMAVVVLILRESPADYGYRLRGTLRHVPIYAAALLAVLPLVYLASRTESFQSRYPFYRDALRGGWHLWGYELCYLLQFWSLEAFFRGFLIFGLRKRFGYYAVIIMLIPYCMIHFNKPVPETLGAIVAGFVLGVLALRSGSFYLGVVVHFAVALSMDLLALHLSGALPF